MSFRAKVMAGLGWTAGARLVGQLIAWPTTILVMRLLNPVDYGLMAMATAVTGFCTLVNELGLPTAVVQTRVLNYRVLRQAFTVVMAVNLVIAALLVLFAPLLADLYNEPRLVPILSVLSVQFPLLGLTVVNEARLRRHMRFKGLGIASTIRNGLSGLISLVLAYLGFGVWALVNGMLAGIVLYVLLLFPSGRKVARLTRNMSGFSALARLGGHSLLQRSSFYVYNYADVLIIGRVLGTAALGVYAVGMQIASMPLGKVGVVINLVGMPAFTTIRNDAAMVSRATRKMIAYLSYASFPVFFGIAAVARPLILLVLGSKWEASIVPLQLLALVAPLRVIWVAVNSAIAGMGRVEITSRLTLLAALMLVPAFWFGTRWGIEGVCWGWLIAYTLWFCIAMRLGLRYLFCGLREFAQVTRWPLCGSLAMAALVYTLGEATLEFGWPLWGTLGLQVVLGVTVFGFVALVLDRAEFVPMVRTLLKRPAAPKATTA